MPDTKAPKPFAMSERVELVATIIMALAAIFTAWAAFESAKWSGIQATSFAKAGAARTESTRFDTAAGQQSGIDVATYTSWLAAVNEDAREGLIDISEGSTYEPTPGTLSGFIYERVRPEFAPAFDAWISAFFANRSTAPPTPFSMDEYVVQDRLRAQEFLIEAENQAKNAAVANQNSDNYVLTVVAFALVLFFGGVAAKLASARNQAITIGTATVLFLGTSVVLFSLPKIWPW